MRRIPLQWIFRALVSCLILGLVLWLLPTGAVWSALRKVPLGLWLLVLVAFLIGHVVNALKWWLLAIRGSGISFSLALRAHFSGLAANLCLPGMAGADVVRAAFVMKKSKDKARLAVGSVADRMIDIFALLFLAYGGAAVLVSNGGGVPGPLVRIGLAVIAASSIVVVILAFAHRLPLHEIIKKAAAAADQIRRRPGALLLCLCLSISVQACFILLTILFAHAVGLNVDTAIWFFAWPLAKLLALLPISISGLGVREAGLATLMSPFGVSAAAVVAVGLIWQTVLLAGGLVGGLALLLSRLHRQPSSIREIATPVVGPLSPVDQ